MVFSSRHGADAIHASERCVEPIDLPFTGIIMPGMSGAELAHPLHVARPRMKVLYMSGDDRLGADAGRSEPDWAA